MFCYIYLKIQIEVKYLLDSHIYTGNQDIILKFNRENFFLEFANILNTIVSLGLLIINILSDGYYSLLINTISAGLESVYLATWSYSLW